MAAKDLPVLTAMPISPWSEKARWALDHHRIRYAEEVYTPMLSEPALRWRLRRARGPVTVPVLFADGEAYTDSFEIAHYAERRGAGAPLFRRGLEAAIARWNRLSDAAMRAGRALVSFRVENDPQARSEALPDLVPRALRRPLDPVARVGVRFLARKYGFRDDEHAHRAELRARLIEMRDALSDGRHYLLGEFTYADIAMAAALQFVAPVGDRHIQLGPASRRAWTDLELAGELTDLLEWRDQLYAARRRA
ncbi:MAG TPA: glutathione S-transferase N-terminal domain-containing protein [Kofleriaceae bacterium]|nr:glutathione S-transferase N-terminal domain-containing protein [Kofleriaceae bacterium]